MSDQLRDFVSINGRLGIIVRNDRGGGVFGGHADVWFGETQEDGTPIVKQLLATDEWTQIEAPMGETRGAK